MKSPTLSSIVTTSSTTISSSSVSTPLPTLITESISASSTTDVVDVKDNDDDDDSDVRDRLSMKKIRLLTLTPPELISTTTEVLTATTTEAIIPFENVPTAEDAIVDDVRNRLSMKKIRLLKIKPTTQPPVAVPITSAGIITTNLHFLYQEK